MQKQHKRFIATILTNTPEGVAPLFDLVVYGATATEADVDMVSTRDTLDMLLRKRNLTLDDFAGFAIYEPMKMPERNVEHVWI